MQESMQEYVDSFLNYMKVERGCSNNTYAAYLNDLSQFLAYLQQLEPARKPRGWGNVTREHILGYMLELKEREYASSTVARKVAAVRSFFAFMVNEGHLR
ncbi:MAG: tyrosine recombinase XerD, partial [Caldilineae bacterium]